MVKWVIALGAVMALAGCDIELAASAPAEPVQPSIDATLFLGYWDSPGGVNLYLYEDGTGLMTYHHPQNGMKDVVLTWRLISEKRAEAMFTYSEKWMPGWANQWKSLVIRPDGRLEYGGNGLECALWYRH
jgi:hypothetical protein